MLVLPPVSATLVAQVFAAALTVALTGALVSFGNSIRFKTRAAKQLKSIPGPNGRFLLGLVPELTKNLYRIYDFQADLLAKYGGRVRMPWNIFGANMVYISDVKDVEHILVKNVDNYIKSEHFVLSVGEVFKKSLLAINHANTPDGGALFRLQRKVVTRVFTTANFKMHTEGIFHKYAMRLVDLINAQDGKCNMHQVASQYTMQTIFDIGCGVPLESFDKDLGLQFVESMDFVFEMFLLRLVTQPYFKYFSWLMPSEYRYKREAKVMTDLIDSVLAKRLAESEEALAGRNDILSLFIKKAREESDGGLMDFEALRSLITAIVFGGRDTTTSTITYAFYNLAQYPEQQDKILEELKTVDMSSMTFDDVKKLRYLDAFIYETLRLYPTTPTNFKHAANDDHLPDGTFIPAGTDVMYSSYYMGRNNAKLWGEDQLVFRPERWLEMKTRPTACELPIFQAGLRICPGMNMGLLEAKIFTAILVKEFHIKMQDGEQIKDRPYFLGATLMMEGGLPLQLTPRVAASN